MCTVPYRMGQRVINKDQDLGKHAHTGVLLCTTLRSFILRDAFSESLDRYKSSHSRRSIEGDKIHIWVISSVIFSRRACVLLHWVMS